MARSPHALSAVVVSLLAAAPAAAQMKHVGKADRLEVIIGVYDVRDIIELAREHPYIRSAPPNRFGEPRADEPVERDPPRGVFSASRGDGIFTEDSGYEFEPSRYRWRGSAVTAESLSTTVAGILRAAEKRFSPEAGGVTAVGGLLVVAATEDGHTAVADTLDAMRRAYDRRPVVVEALWVPLTPEAAAQLLGRGRNAGRRMVLDAPAEFPAAAYTARLAGLDRQPMHVAAGPATLFVGDLIPVVSHAAVAYRAVTETLQFGPVLEACVTLSPDATAAALRVDSTVTEMTDRRVEDVMVAPQGADGNSPPATGKMDLFDFDVHTLATTVRVPVGKLVVLGAMTPASGKPAAGAAEADRPVLYLFARVGVGEGGRVAAPVRGETTGRPDTPDRPAGPRPAPRPRQSKGLMKR